MHVLLSDESPSMFLAATWRFAGTANRRLVALMSVSKWRETMSISAGVCRSAAGLSDSRRPQWSGIIDGSSIAAYRKQQKGYARPRHCWLINGRNIIMDRAILQLEWPALWEGNTFDFF